MSLQCPGGLRRSARSCDTGGQRVTGIDAPHSFVAYRQEARLPGQLPLRNHRILATRDVGKMHREVARALCSHNATSAVRGRPQLPATLHHAPLASTSAIYLHYGIETRVRVEELGFFLLEVQLSGACETTFGRDTASTTAGCMIVAGPNRRFSSHWDEDCSKLLFKIDALALEQQLAVILGRSPNRALTFTLMHPIGTGPAASLWRNLQLLIGELEDPVSLLNTVPGAGREAEQRLLWTLLHVLPSNYSSELRMQAPDSGRSYLERVEEYIYAHCAEPLTLARLAQVAGVSGRSLLEGFRRHRGISPMRLLKLARLDRARGDLLKAAPDAVSVTAVAMKWGFQHLGRFSGDYKRRFGESPSRTLQREPAAG